MNSTIFLHILLNLFGQNKCQKSIVYIDCGQNMAKISKIISNDSFSVVIFDLNIVSNASDPIASIMRDFRRANQLGIILNYDCVTAKDVVESVSFTNLCLKFILFRKYFVQVLELRSLFLHASALVYF